MASKSKPSGASVTASGHDIFSRARLKLAVVYAVIVAVIVIGFSAILYQNLRRSLFEADDGDFADVGSQQQFVERTLTSFDNDLLLADVVIIALAGLLGYALAGYTLRPIRRSLEAQQEFAEKASHELRTPLAVMRSDLEVLLRHPSPSREAVRETLRSDIEEIDCLTAMTDDLLTQARSRINPLAALQKVDLAETAGRTVEKMRSLAEKKGVTITSAANVSVDVLGHRGELARVLTNLLQNAVEHTPPGGSVTVETRAAGPRALVTVADTGTGISPRDLPHVFERFYKGAGAQGSGLGLAIVKELVARHRGEVLIESPEGRGTKVTVRLPLAG